MKFLVQRQLPDQDGNADDPAPPVSTLIPKVSWPVVVCLEEGPVRVTIIEEPRLPAHDNACRCGGCHSSVDADWAGHFLP